MQTERLSGELSFASKGYPSVCSHWDRKQEAEDWAKGVEGQIKAGQFKFDQHNKIHTFSELIERYKQDGALEHHRSAQDTLRHLAYWQSRFANFSLVHLTPELLGKERQLLVDTPTSKGTKRTSSTVNRYMASLSSILTYAAAKGASNLQLQTATGHRTLSMLLHYTHLDVAVTKQFSHQISDQILKGEPL